MKKLPLNPNVEIFRWGPVPGKFLYESDFMDSIFDIYPKKYKGFGWSKTLFLFRNDRLIWINEFPALRKAGIKNFLHFMINHKRRTRLKKEWNEIVRKILKQHLLFERINLTKLSNQELYDLAMGYNRLIVDFWTPTIAQELGNYGSDFLLQKELMRFISDPNELSKAMEIFTAPEELSFYQQEELDLAKTQNITKHQQKYFWLHNSYAGAKILPISFFEKRKKKLPKNINQKLFRHLKGTKIKKVQLQQQYRLPLRIMNISRALSEGVVWQDRRKMYEFIKIHYKTLLVTEIAKRTGYKFRDLENFSTFEIIQTL